MKLQDVKVGKRYVITGNFTHAYHIGAVVKVVMKLEDDVVLCESHSYTFSQLIPTGDLKEVGA